MGTAPYATRRPESAPASRRLTGCWAAWIGATTSSGSSNGTPVEPFYSAIASQTDVSETKAAYYFGRAVTYGIPGVTIIDAAPGAALASPSTCLRESTACAQPREPPADPVRVARQHGTSWGCGDARASLRAAAR